MGTMETVEAELGLGLHAARTQEAIRCIANEELNISELEALAERIEKETNYVITRADAWFDFIEKADHAKAEQNAWFYVMRDAVRKALKTATHMSWDRLEAISEAKEINNSVSYARAILRGTTRPLNANLSAAVHYYYIGAVTIPKDELLFYNSDQQSYVEALKTLYVLGLEFCEKIRDTEICGSPAINRGWWFFVDCFERDVAPAIRAELHTIGVTGGAV
jgi:hypothetical protein